ARARQHATRLDAPDVAARLPGERPRNKLHGKAQRPGGRLLAAGTKALQPLEQRGALVPGQRLATPEDHVAVQRRARNRLEAVEIEVLQRRLRVADQVHLVDEGDALADAEQARELEMAARRRCQAL